MPELREALGSFRPTSNGADGNLVPMFTASLRDTFNAADRSTEAIPPAMFVQVCVPQQQRIATSECVCVLVTGSLAGLLGYCWALSCFLAWTPLAVDFFLF